MYLGKQWIDSHLLAVRRKYSKKLYSTPVALRPSRTASVRLPSPSSTCNVLVLQWSGGGGKGGSPDSPGGNPGGGSPGPGASLHNLPASTRILIWGERCAPTFNGVPQYLNKYFANVKHIFWGYHTDDQMLIDVAIEYLSHDVVDLWEAQICRCFHTWWTYQVAIWLLYPGSDRQWLYLVMDLKHVMEGSNTRGIFTRGNLGKYHYQFTQISLYLLQHSLIEVWHVNQL